SALRDTWARYWPGRSLSLVVSGASMLAIRMRSRRRSTSRVNVSPSATCTTVPLSWNSYAGGAPVWLPAFAPPGCPSAAAKATAATADPRLRRTGVAFLFEVLLGTLRFRPHPDDVIAE